jgi:hypothetical protein
MPRACTICAHPKRKAIDKALAADDPVRGLSALYRVSEDALSRHRDKHLPARMAEASQAQAVSHGDTLIEQLERLTADARSIKGKAEAAADYRTALAGIRELVRIVELLAKLRGELDERAVVNVLVAAPEWVQLRARILLALEPFPEARRAVVEAIRPEGPRVH